MKSRAAILMAVAVLFFFSPRFAHSAAAGAGLRVAADQSDQSAVPPEQSAPKNGDTSAPAPEEPNGAVHHCQVGCAEPCQIFTEPDLGKMCIEACEEKCGAARAKE